MPFFFLKANFKPVRATGGKKPGRWAPRRAWVAPLAALLAVFLIPACKAQGAGLITDDFDALSTGALQGQNSWVGTAAVTDARAQTLPNSITGGTADKEAGGALATGREEIYFQPDATNKTVTFYIQPTGGPYAICGVNCSSGYCDSLGGGELHSAYTADEWHGIFIEWTDTPAKKCRYCFEATCTGWVAPNYWPDINPQRVHLDIDADAWVDDLNDGTFIPTPPESIIFSDPALNDTTCLMINEPITAWTLEASFNNAYPEILYDISISASSTLVMNATATTTAAGLFHIQKISDVPTGGVSVRPVLDNTIPLIPGTLYYAKATVGDLTGDTYTLLATSILGEFQQIHYMELGNATTSASWYAENVPAFFGTTTPTVIFTGITGVFDLILNPVLNVLEWFNNLFDTTSSYNNGAALGAAIALIFVYANQINLLFAFPIVEISTFLIIIEIALIIWKQSTRGIKTVK